MPITRIANFGRAALNTDVHETLLQPGEWTFLENIDVESGDIRSAWGESQVAASAPITPTYIYVFEGVGDTWLIISDGSEVYSYDGSAWTDISPSDTQTTALQWQDGNTIGNGSWGGAGAMRWGDAETGGTPVEISGDVWFDVFLGTLIVSSSGGIPCYWPGETGRLQPLPNWPTAWRSRMVVSFGNFLVAIALNDGEVAGDKYRVAWSDAAAEGQVPQDWLSVPGNLAGSVQLRDSDGYLTTAKILRDNLIIYKQDSIYRMYQRGDQFVFGFERIISDHGCDSPNGVSNLGDVHYFADRGDIRVFNGQTTQSIAAFKIREQLAISISNESRDKTYVVAYPELEKLYVGVVPAGQSGIVRVLIYDLEHQAWSPKLYPNAISMTLGPFAATSVASGRTWGEQLGTWGSAEDTWGGSALEPTEDGILLGLSTGAVIRVDKSTTDFNGNAKSCSAERVGYVLADIPQNITLKSVWPEMEGDATVQIQLGARWFPGAPVRWTQERDFTPGITKHIPVRITGQPCAFRIRSASTSGWRLSALNLEYTPASRR